MLRAAVLRLPRGAGVIFRHYGVPGRAALAAGLRALCRRRGLVFLAADDDGGPALKADGSHRPAARVRSAGRWPPGLRTAAAHSARELAAAWGAGADLAFLSPVYRTASHPGASPLGPVRFALAARRVALPVYALGGMDRRRFRHMRAWQASGWGGIDAFCR